MRVSLVIALVFLAAVTLAIPAAAIQPLPAPNMVVERFEAASACVAALPGTLEGKFVRFEGVETVTSLSFSPGSVSLGGKSVEFHGHEDAFMKSDFNGDLRVPNSPGRSVTGTIDGTVTGAVNCTANVVIDGLVLGDNFSERGMDTEVGTSDTQVTEITDYQSSVVPELNGEKLTIYSTREITGIDTVNHIMTMEMKGSITVPARRIIEPLDDDGDGNNPDKDELPDLGQLLLFFGVIGTTGLLITNFRD